MTALLALAGLLFLALLVVVDLGVGMRRAERAADVAVRQVHSLTCRVHIAEDTLRALDVRVDDVERQVDVAETGRAGIYDHETEEST